MGGVCVLAFSWGGRRRGGRGVLVSGMAFVVVHGVDRKYGVSRRG